MRENCHDEFTCGAGSHDRDGSPRGEDDASRSGDGSSRDGDDASRSGDGTSRSGDSSSRGEDDAHLKDVPVGAGCTEIWEHLAEAREE